MKVLQTVSFLLVSVLTLAFVAACNGDDDNNDVGNGNGAVTIESPSIDYEPDTISMSAGEDLEVTLDNTDTQPHTFTIDELDIDLEVAGGESDSVTISAPDAGEYEFYCRIPGHREAGQVGTLTVN